MGQTAELHHSVLLRGGTGRDVALLGQSQGGVVPAQAVYRTTAVAHFKGTEQGEVSVLQCCGYLKCLMFWKRLSFSL